jgi:WD40 repeat protein
VTLWDTRSRSVVRRLQFRRPVVWVAVSPDSQLLAVQTQARGSREARVEVRDLSSGETLYRHGLPYGGRGLSFSPDGRSLAALGCCEPASIVEVWAARSGTRRFSHKGHATAIAFSPGGGLLGAGTADGKLVLWRARDGTLVGSPIQVATETVDSFSFATNGRLFAVSSADQTATLWDLRARKRLGNSFPVRQGAVPGAQFAPKGDLLIVYLADAAQWPTDPRKWERFACQVAGRDLTRAEWSDLLPNRPYQHVCLH